MVVQASDRTASHEPPAPATRRVSWSPTAAALVLGTLWGLSAMGSSATSVVLGELSTDLELGTTATAWVFTAFALAFAAATPVFGRVADAVGPRGPYVAGGVLLAAGASLAALAPTLEVLLAARLLQGVGAGAIPVLTTAILSACYDGDERAVALGRTNSAVVVLSSVGPLLGGALGALAGWRLPFALPVLALLIVPFASRLAPARGTGARFDVRGAVLVAGTAAALLTVVQTIGQGGPVAVAALVALPVLVAGTVRHVAVRPDGFLPRRAIGESAVVRAATAAATMPAVYFAGLVAVPLVLASRGWTPLENGLLLLPGAAVGALVSFNSAPLLARLGRRRTAMLGLAFSTVGALVASGVGLSSVLAGVGFVGLAVGYALAQPALAGTVAAAAPPDVRGAALGVFSLLFFIGAGLGSAVVGGLGDLLGLPGALAVAAAAPAAGVAVLATAPASAVWSASR